MKQLNVKYRISAAENSFDPRMNQPLPDQCFLMEKKVSVRDILRARTSI